MAVDLIEFREDLAAEFARLNYRWIEHHFSVEAEDVKALENPVAYALVPGGMIYFVLVDGVCAGTVAMVPKGEGVFELAKMAVDPGYQGQGLSHRLMQACVDFARDRNAAEVTLTTNDGLAPALGLYEHWGFVAEPVNRDARYARGNLQMRLDLRVGSSLAR